MIKRQNKTETPPKEKTNSGKNSKAKKVTVEEEREPTRKEMMQEIQRLKDAAPKKKTHAPIYALPVETTPEALPVPKYSLGLSGNHPELNVFRGKVKTNGVNIQVALLELVKSYK